MSAQGNSTDTRTLQQKGQGGDEMRGVMTNKITRNARNPLRRMKKRARQQAKRQIREHLESGEYDG